MREATPAAASDPAEDSARDTRWLMPRPVRIGVSVGSLVVSFVVLLQWMRGLVGDLHSIAGRYDFSTYYAAAYALRHNLHADIYSQTVLTQAGAAAHVLVQPPLAYTYPPLFALLLSPFTVLSFQVLSRLWLVGNAALWLLVITALLTREMSEHLRPVMRSPRVGTGQPADGSAPRGLRPPSLPARAGRMPFFSGLHRERAGAPVLELLDNPLLLLAPAIALWLSLTFAPAVQTLLTGQINFLVLAPLALVPLLLRGGHDRWAGVAIAVAAILKFTPALLIVYLLLRRRWQAAAAAVFVLVGLFALSALVVGPGVAGASITQALHVGTGDAALGHNQALFAPLLVFVGLHAPAQLAPATLLARVALVLLALALGYAIWRLPVAGAYRTPLHATDPGTAPDFTASDAAAYGLALCGLLLLSPTAWVHHYVWVLPAAAIALGLAVSWLIRALGTHHLASAVVSLSLTALACAALGVSLPNDWDTNPHPAFTHAGLFAWPLALLMRPLATLVLAGLLVYLGNVAHPSGRAKTATAHEHETSPVPRA